MDQENVLFLQDLEDYRNIYCYWHNLLTDKPVIAKEFIQRQRLFRLRTKLSDLNEINNNFPTCTLLYSKYLDERSEFQLNIPLKISNEVKRAFLKGYYHPNSFNIVENEHQ
ncbi:hypothetical protein O9G_002636 [Rozella allomycis CSF55]|uniref:Uncharacterized protein n=1 Tax=Rozella allomycis (strain CSF55) TaxID=988480 RepID=A0A075B3W3_ROZAC|nr:hypothetical protein O9G_002636 [Rozella allomycis CSF55]|eukprot:EPZ35628.1 hypothetical protein O9G_002636 [Rozella allomycis CSF55]